MNRIYHLIWCRRRAASVAVSEHACGAGKEAGACIALARNAAAAGFALKTLVGLLMLAFGGAALAAPAGGVVLSGSGGISQSGASTTIRQTSQNLAIDWQSFNIAPQEMVTFVQPSASALAVNRIFDVNGSQILGKLNANGQIYLINPNGILFGAGAQVNVGGLVASTLDLNSVSADGRSSSFGGSGSGSVINRGSITAANGGYVALLGKQAANHGSIVASGGTVALGAGSAATLTFADNRLVKMQIDQSLLGTLAENGGLIRADGGTVLMSAGAKDALLASVVNNSGVIEARTVENRDGKIILLGGMAAGTANIGGTLDASAPNGGNGGFIETSAARVNIADDARISTAAPHGKTGNWLIDPQDFVIAASGGNISGAALSNLLSNNSVTVQTGAGADTTTDRYGTSGSNGDIFVNDGVNWSANTLTLKAHRNIDINARMNGSDAAKLAFEYGQGAVAAGNTSKVTVHAAVNLPEGDNYSTKLGSDGAVKSYTVITRLGDANDLATGASTLQGMAAAANLGRNFALGANIDAAATSSWNSFTGFTPIGNASTAYSGSFDGLGHDISGLVLRPGFTSNSNTYVGLFGRTAVTADVRNVGLSAVTVHHFAESRTGALIGMNEGKVANSYAEGSVRGNTHVGGLVGVNQATGSIEGSYFSGSATAGNRVGGLVGVNGGSISDSYSTGQVSSSAGQDFIGGLVGQNGGSISRSYVSATVFNGSNDPGRRTGSLTGYNSGTVSDSYWNRDMSAIVGIDGGTTTGATGLTDAQMKQQSSFTNWDFASTWYAQEGQSAPLHRAFLAPLTVTAKNLTKAYDGTAYTDQSGVSFSATPDMSRLSGTIHYGAVSDGPVNVGTHTLTPTGYVTKARGYIITYAAGTLIVDPAVINLGGTKTYDAGVGFASANFGAGGAISTGIGSETLVLSGAGSVASANVSAGAQSLNLGSLALGNGSGQASNYTLIGGSHTGTVTPKALTAVVSAPDRVYDGTNAASPTLTITSGLAGFETLQVSGSATFDNKNAGVAKTVTVNSVSLADGANGGLASNYTLAAGQTTVASITPRVLTIGGITAGDKVYDGSTAATVNTTGASYVGLVTGDAVTVSASGTFSDKNAGAGKIVNLSSSYAGADLRNYTITGQNTATASITPKALTIGGITAGDKVYDGSTIATVNTTGATYAGLVAGDAVTVSASGTFSDKNAGAGKAVNLSSSYAGADVGNYTIIGQNMATASITPKALAIGGITAGDKVYDGSTAATVNTTGATYAGLVAGDAVTVSASGTFSDKNVGVGKAVNLSSSYAGADVGNYTIVGQNMAAASITPKALTIGGITAGDKVYDGSTAATVSVAGASFGGLVAGDDVTASASGTFVDKNAGNGKVVNLSSSYAGADVGNYMINEQNTATASITPKTLTIGGIAAVDKVYDGSTAATVDTTGASYAGLVTGDNLIVSTSGTFVDKNVGNDKVVNLSSSYAGTDVGNYAITGQATAMANITLKALVIDGITAADKVYDGSTAATVNLTGATYAGLVAGDSLTVSATGTFGDKNAGNGKVINLSSSYAGADVNNYMITGQAATMANITPKALSIGGITAGDKVYDGSTAATVNTTGASYAGLVAGDNVTVSASGAFSDKNAGAGKIVNLSSSYAGADLRNYTITGQNTATASITPKALTIAGITAADKVYDGSTVATVNVAGVSFGGLVAGDAVTVSASGTFSDKNVGAGKAVNLSSSYAGADMGNYTITGQNMATASITPRALTIGGITAADKVYDGSTAATVSVAGASFGGLVAGDNVTVSASGTFSDKNAGIGKTVNLSSSYAGADVGNYTITGQAVTTADIGRADLVVTGLAANDKLFDGTAVATLRGRPAVAAFGNDAVAVEGIGSAAFADANVGSGKAVTASGFTLGGTDAGNYKLVQPIGLTASIADGAPPPQAHNAAGQLQSQVLPFRQSSAPGGHTASSTIARANTDSGPGSAASASSAGESTNLVVLNVGDAGSRLTVENGGVRLPDHRTGE